LAEKELSKWAAARNCSPAPLEASETNGNVTLLNFADALMRTVVEFLLFGQPPTTLPQTQDETTEDTEAVVTQEWEHMFVEGLNENTLYVNRKTGKMLGYQPCTIMEYIVAMKGMSTFSNVSWRF
jgi:hypothetical protein